MTERETLEVDVADRRRRAGRDVGGAAAGAAAEGRRAASRWRLPCSRRRARPARTCCRAPCSTRRRCASWCPTSRSQGRAAGVRGAARRRVFPDARLARSRFPITPPPLANHGNYIISLNRFVKWLGGLVEAEGIDVFTGFPATEGALRRGSRRRRAHRRPRASASTAERKPTFEPGVDIRAKVTILADGVRGNLTKAVVRRLALDAGRLPQIYALGIKELWEVPPGRIAPGTVIHTLGYPLRMEEFGGGFIYAHAGRAAVGRLRVRASTTSDPMFDPHVAFQHFKRHPFVSSLLAGGQMVRYGAKALPEGGWHTIPRVYVRRRADRRRRRRLPELDAPEGHSPGDAHRHAGGRDRVRRGHERRYVGGAAARATRTAIGASDVKRELYPVRNVHQASATACSRGWPIPGCRWCPAAGGCAIRCRRTPASSGWRRSPATTGRRARIPTRREPREDRSAADLRSR